LLLATVIVALVGAHITYKKFKFFTESGSAIICGMMIAVFGAYVFKDGNKMLEGNAFIYILLPPILFAEGTIQQLTNLLNTARFHYAVCLDLSVQGYL